jgi:catechol 2,3-dioxygenase-like lactoylglutathione lyase family enzyme
MKAPQFTSFRALSIAGMKRCDIIVACGDGRAGKIRVPDNIRNVRRRAARPDSARQPAAWREGARPSDSLELRDLEDKERSILFATRKGYVKRTSLDEFQNTCAALDAKGVKWVAPPNSREDFGVTVWAAFIEDPDGNIIELTNAGPSY